MGIMTSTGLLPMYNRYGVPVLTSSRKHFRQKERFIIFIVFITFAMIFCATFFYLPELRTQIRSSNNVYHKVYKRMQSAGPEFLIPIPPFKNDNTSMLVSPARHNNLGDFVDPHLVEDRNKLLAKIEDDRKNQKVLERPDIGLQIKTSSASNVQVQLAPVDEKDNSILTVPPADSDRYPVIQGGEDKDPDIRSKRQKIKEMMSHAWNGYVEYAWGMNELKPVSKRPHNQSVFGGAYMGATIVDSLDTLYIMGMRDEFKKARDWVQNHLNVDDINLDISVFETTIRFIGGLLSCYAFTGDVMFRDKAEQIADKLLPAFQTPTGIPHSLVNFKTGLSKNYGWASGSSSILSELGTLHLEFVYLSEVTGKQIYSDKVFHIRNVLKQMDKPNGLYPNYINPKTGKWGQHHMSLGGLGDSFYEYLLKASIQSNQDMEARELFDQSMNAVIQHMLQTSPSGLTYISDLKFDRLEYKMDALACFAGGLFGLASHTTTNKEISNKYLNIAHGIANTCHEAYARSETGLAPESFKFSDALEAKALKSSDKYYILRPETVESYFILWRLTKNPKYREWGWNVVQALEKYCKAEAGYSGIRNVYSHDPIKDDVQQSYFLAEMLKYLYLLFSDDELISLDQWVFNSEAHPLPVKGVNPYYRPYRPSASKILF